MFLKPMEVTMPTLHISRVIGLPGETVQISGPVTHIGRTGLRESHITLFRLRLNDKYETRQYFQQTNQIECTRNTTRNFSTPHDDTGTKCSAF